MVVMATPFWRRRRTKLFIAVTLFPIITIFIATRSFVLSPIVASILQDNFGGNFEVGETHLDWSGGISLENVKLLTGDGHGIASELITITSAKIVFNNLISFQKTQITSIDIDTVVIRLADITERPGEYSLSHLLQNFRQQKSGEELIDEAEDKQRFLPTISLKELVVEIGQLDNSKWYLNNKRSFSVTRVESDSKQYEFAITNDDDSLRMRVVYIPQESELSVEIDEILMDESLFELLPLPARIWCEKTELQGGLKQLEITFNNEDGLTINCEVEDIIFSPQETNALPWVHYEAGDITRLYGNALLHIETGQIVYNGKDFTLQSLQGTLHPPLQDHGAPVAFLADLELFDLHPIDQISEEWFMSVISNTRLRGTLTIEEFQSSREVDGELDLPLAAAQILKIFQMEQWNINAKVDVTRTEVGGELEVNGILTIDAALAKYEGFQYPLHDVKSTIKFHQDEIHIVFLQARGSGDSTVHISGDIQAAKDFLDVHLHLHVEDAPLDKILHDVVDDQFAYVMERLLDVDALNKVSAVLPNTYGQTFSLGGKVDLDLELKHDSRVGDNVDISGSISFKNIGIVHEVFPYPVTLQDGTILLDKTGLRIKDGSAVRFEGAGGGSGTIEGHISFLESVVASPELTLSLTNEKVTPALIEAISISAGESYDVALSVLSGLGLESRLNVEGRIYGDANGEIGSNFTILVKDGEATPDVRLAKAIHATNTFWPDDFQFTSVNAEIKIINGAVTIDAATCQCESGSLGGSGSLEVSMSIDKGEFTLVIYGHNLPLGPNFVDVLPSTASSKLADAWDWLDPGGRMDAEIRMSSRDGESSLNMVITPMLVTVSGNDQIVNLELMRGSIVVVDTDVFLNDLEFQLLEDGSPQGMLHIGGEVHAERNEYQFNIEANWDAAAINSPLTRAIIGMVGDESGVEYYDSIQPDGHASANLVASGNANSIIYDIHILPSILSASFQGKRATAIFSEHDNDFGNVIHFHNSGIIFENLHGKLGDGNFTLQGSIETESAIDGVIDFTWSGPADDKSLFAVLPRTVGDTFEKLKLTDGTSVMDDGNVTIRGDDWSELVTEFTGNIAMKDVSINVGIPLNKIHGTIHVDGKYDVEALSKLMLEFDIKEMTALGRSISYLDGTLRLDTMNQRMVFDGMRGESSSGGITLEGWIAVDETKLFEIKIFVAGVELARNNADGNQATLQGELTGWLSIAGVQGDINSRRGVGMLRVQNGYLAINPLSIAAMQVMQFAIPSASSITGAEIDIYIDEDQMILDHIKLTCSESPYSDLILEGTGTIDTETFNLDARLHPRAGLPILRDITGAIFDQLYSIEVTGELLDPTVTVVIFPFLSP